MPIELLFKVSQLYYHEIVPGAISYLLNDIVPRSPRQLVLVIGVDGSSQVLQDRLVLPQIGQVPNLVVND